MHGEKAKESFDIDGGDEMISTHLQPLYDRAASENSDMVDDDDEASYRSDNHAFLKFLYINRWCSKISLYVYIEWDGRKIIIYRIR